MDLYEECMAYSTYSFNVLRKYGLLTVDRIPYGTFRATLRKNEGGFKSR